MDGKKRSRVTCSRKRERKGTWTEIEHVPEEVQYKLHGPNMDPSLPPKVTCGSVPRVPRPGCMEKAFMKRISLKEFQSVRSNWPSQLRSSKVDPAGCIVLIVGNAVSSLCI